MRKKRIEQHKKEVLEVSNTPAVSEVAVSDVCTPPAMSIEELLTQKAIRDSLDSEKSKKDVLIRTVTELEASVKDLSAKRDSLAGEYNARRSVLDNLTKSIQSATYELTHIKATFEDKNASLLAEINKRQWDVNKADYTLQNLIRENREKEKAIANDQAAFIQEREQNRQRVRVAEVDLSQVNTNWKRAEEDILRREKELKLAKDEFEVYRESLRPEINHITEIKNENVLLLQKIERDKNQLEHMRISVDRERKAMQESQAVKDHQVEQMKLKIANEEARLRRWEQNIKDQSLELQAKESEMARIIRRYKLESELAQDKKNAE